MSTGAFAVAETGAPVIGAPRPPSRWLGWLHRGENLLLVLLLAAMMILPVLEVLRRIGLPVGVQGADDFLRHLNLRVGMLGGLVAAREGRLLALSTIPSLLKRPWAKGMSAMVSGAVAAVIATALCVASMRFVAAEKESGRVMAYD